MATVVLNISSLDLAKSWATGGTTASELDSGETSNQWLSNNGEAAQIIGQLDDYSAGGTVDSVQVSIVAFYGNARSGVVTAHLDIKNAGGSTLYSEAVSVTTNSGAHALYNYTSRTTSDGSTPWTDSDLDGLYLHWVFSPPAAGSVTFLQQAYLTVTYSTAAVMAKVNGVTDANIDNVIGVANDPMAKINGITDTD